MTQQIKFKEASIEYLKSQSNQIITVLGLKSSVNSELISCLRRLELLAKRSHIKEIWFPDSLNNELQKLGEEIIKKLGYKPCILGVHPISNEKLKGLKKIIK